MFCQNCGYALSEHINFCPQCGHRQEANIQQAEQTASDAKLSPAEMNREVTVQYLYDVRALEIAKKKLQEKIAENTEKCKQLGIPQLFTKPDFKLKRDILIYGLLSLGFAVFMAFIGYSQQSGIVAVIAAISGFVSTGYFIFYFSKQSKYNQEYVVYTNAVSNDQKRVEEELAEKSKLEQEVQDMQGELSEAEDLLAKSYAVNLVPKQFRDIYSIFYLYEYLSTSQESLQSALLHYNLEEIKVKIDEVIQMQSEIILQQAIQTAHLEEMQRQNTRMLKHAAATEQNTALAAQYAQIAANNAEACAWIGVANYIK